MTDCDILIVGAGTAGTYFGWQMAARGHSVVIVGILSTVPSAANASRRENSYLFEKDVIFSEEDLTDMNRDFEMHLTTRKILRIFRVIMLGVLTGNYSIASLRALLRSVRISGWIRRHYEAFPEKRSDFASWVDTAEDLWRQADPKMS
jgi:nucleoside-diphosphate-sugar epimerase